MVPLRLKAWARAMVAAEAMKSCVKSGADMLFLTDGQDVLAQIRELFPTAQTRSGLNPLPAKRGRPDVEHLPVWLAGPLIRHAEQASDENGVRLSGLELIEIPHLSVEGFLNRLAGHADRTDSDGSGAVSTGSCWIGALLRAGEGSVFLSAGVEATSRLGRGRSDEDTRNPWFRQAWERSDRRAAGGAG